ncbi:spore germination protein [Paenibacillus glycinis]|uniref:Spore germination protein n=1 Tax=Paenibacillus glycinis TaxID=2697035 RepID=A0ABW9XMJ2_9BACL|nr:spore germination protein [Paenibacillus glycinis]NBD23781.1 spore germination protein [Paenibacillus glycinis]
MNEQMQSIAASLDTFFENNADARREQIDAEPGFILYYIWTITDPDFIDQQLKMPFFRYSREEYELHLRSISQAGDKPEDLPGKLCKGCAVILYGDQVYTVAKSVAYRTRSVDTPQVEASIVGPLEAFVESMAVNLNLIRKHYQSPNLRIVKFEVGTLSHITGYMLYDSELADQAFVKRELQQIDNLNAKNAQAVSKVQQYLPKKRPLLFPRTVVTERPDRVSEALSKGKSAYLIETTPFASLAPINFHDFMASMDDSYMLPVYSYFLIALRYFALFATVVLPGAYVAFTAFNPEVFRVQLALSIAGSRAGLPYPAFLEVAFMMIMTELLVEASLRVPKTIGPAATTVGGLILGEAASQANLVSDIMIIVVASVAIANFVIPINTMSLTVRVLKYVLLFLGTIAGFFGLTVGIVLLVSYLFTMHDGKYSLVQSYTAPVKFNTGRAPKSPAGGGQA